MAQITLRLDDGKANQLRLLAQREERSVNALLLSLVDVVLDPDTAANRDVALYERFVRAGIVDPRDEPVGPAPKRPSDRDIARARAALAGGPLASDLVIEERG